MYPDPVHIGLDMPNSVSVITIKSVLSSSNEERTDTNLCGQQFVVNSRIKTSFKQPCFDSACFKPTDSKNLHIPPHCLQFLVPCHIDCSRERSSKLFYTCEEGDCFTKALSYLLTATNAQSRIERRRRMPQQPNRYSKGKRRAEKRKSAGVSRQSERSLDEAVPGGVRTSSDTLFAESKIKRQSKVVGAHDLQEQSIIIHHQCRNDCQCLRRIFFTRPRVDWKSCSGKPKCKWNSAWRT